MCPISWTEKEKGLDRKFDLCTGRDAKGRRWAARVPAGVVRTGMFLRLLGGIFVLVERVEQGGSTELPLCAAVEVLQSVWEGRSHD